jgi:glycosyltransferase involved in cell wall biosynthesis
MVFIGGQGPEKGALAKQVQDLELANVVQLIGPILPDDVYTWMAAADICVVPSRTEPFGLAAIEALASGTPVIAAEIGGLMESIQHEYNGLLFPVADEQALSKCMQQLLADGSMRERMAAVARKSVGRFDMRLQADEVLKIYRTL